LLIAEQVTAKFILSRSFAFQAANIGRGSTLFSLISIVVDFILGGKGQDGSKSQ